MSTPNTPEKVVLTVASEWPGVNGHAVDEIEMDPDQWARLTPDEREELCAETAAEVFQSYCNYGFEVEVTP